MKIWFEDFWYPNSGPVEQSHGIWNSDTLKRHNLILDPNPDVLVYSVFGVNHKKYKCRKILFSSEDTTQPAFDRVCDRQAADFAIISNEPRSEKEFRLSEFWCRHGFEGGSSLLCRPSINLEEVPLNDICMINSHLTREREIIMRSLKTMHVYGKLGNKEIVPRYPPSAMFDSKMRICSKYKFMVVTETYYTPGYNDEKLYESYCAGCIPVYWGDSQIHESGVNMSAILTFNESDLGNLENRLISLGRDHKSYLETRKQFLVSENYGFQLSKQFHSFLERALYE